MSDEIRLARRSSLLSRVWQAASALTRRLGYAAVVGLALQILAILLSHYHPLLELANHFALHGLVIAIATVGALWIQTRKSRLAIAVLLLETGYLLLLVQPWGLYWNRPPAIPAELNQSISVLSWNVLAVNQDYAGIDQVIRDVDADVVVLIETQPNLLEHLPYLTVKYPMSHKILHWGGNGICVFSKIPGTEFVTEPFRCVRQPAIVATIPAAPDTSTNTNRLHPNHASVKLVGMHTLSPIPVRRTATRDEQLAALGKWSREQTLPICVCGDLNTTPWTRSFVGLKQAGFIDSRRGVGNLASWPSALGRLGIPIDHALSRGNCRISQRQVLAAVPGSDHRPISFRLHY